MQDKMSKRIYERRKSLNMTMEELGNKTGVSKSTVNKWEKGQIQNIKRSTIQKLADVLECSPTWLIGIDDTDKTVPKYVPGTVRIIDLYSRITPEQRKIVLNLLESMVSD